MRTRLLSTALAVLLLCLGKTEARAGELLGVRHHTDGARTRVVLDLERAANYRLREVDNPHRIVIEIPGTRLRATAPIEVERSALRRIRFNRLSTKAQIVLDLEGEHGYRHFALDSHDSKPARIVIDIELGSGSVATAPAAHPVELPEIAVPDAREPYVIVIDPGHGGRDAGTTGCGIAVEKHVALGIAKELAAQLGSSPDFKVILTRQDDRFVELQDRVRIAEQGGGDLFVSIHCNSARSSGAQGAEVYFLSPRGATDQAAAELADRENAAHKVGVDPSEPADEEIVSILMDLKGTAILQRSSQLAEMSLSEIGDGTGISARAIKQARFAVLRNLSMPSILVEAGFLTNRSEAKRLRDPSTQRKIARALSDAVIEYCRRYGEKGRPALAHRVHHVRSGETLWDLARAYDTSVSAISAANDLSGSRIRVGQELVLP